MKILMEDEPDFDSVLDKVFDAQELTKDEKVVLDIYSKLFGSCEPMPMNEYVAKELGDETQYLEFLEKFKEDCYEKALMISGSYFHGMFGNDHMTGAVVLFDAYHNVYPNTMLLILRAEGEAGMENELMGKEEKHVFYQEDMSFIRKDDVLGLNLTRHCCPRPDCEFCENKRDNPQAIPYMVEVIAASGKYPTIQGSMTVVMPMLENIQMWLQAPNTRKNSLVLKVEYWLRRIKEIFVKKNPAYEDLPSDKQNA